MLSRKINTKFTVSRQNSKVSSKKVLRCFFMKTESDTGTPPLKNFLGLEKTTLKENRPIGGVF